MKKFLVFKENTDQSVKKLYPEVLYWVSNSKGQELGTVEKFKFGRKTRVASNLEEDTMMTVECHRQLADFMEKLEKASTDDPQADNEGYAKNYSSDATWP